MNKGQYQTGVSGEQMAEEYLAARGMTCEARRWRGGSGEIDLIMRDGDYLVFVEVKYRPKSRAGTGLMAVTPAKRRRMVSAAMNYLMEQDDYRQPVRFDCVEITADGILHIPNAFAVDG